MGRARSGAQIFAEIRTGVFTFTCLNRIPDRAFYIVEDKPKSNTYMDESMSSSVSVFYNVPPSLKSTLKYQKSALKYQKVAVKTDMFSWNS